MFDCQCPCHCFYYFPLSSLFVKIKIKIMLYGYFADNWLFTEFISGVVMATLLKMFISDFADVAVNMSRLVCLMM